MGNRILYSVVGVSRDATQAEIKRAYHKLAHKFHPDVSKEADAEARFKDLGEAYRVLGNPAKRAIYDRLEGQARPREAVCRGRPLYRIEGRNLFLVVPVTPREATLGARVRVPTPYGMVDLRIPASSRAGSKLRLRGRGLKGMPRGDLIVVLQLTPPLTDGDTAGTRSMQTQDRLRRNAAARYRGDASCRAYSQVQDRPGDSSDSGNC